MQRGRVLVVEDRAAIRSLVEVGLARAGLEVRTVAGAGEAFGAIRALMPDLVITDLVLPDGAGDALIGALRADPRTRALPVIVLSGLPGAAQVGTRAGADECIAKPFDVEHLIGRVLFHLGSAGRSSGT